MPSEEFESEIDIGEEEEEVPKPSSLRSVLTSSEKYFGILMASQPTVYILRSIKPVKANLEIFINLKPQQILNGGKGKVKTKAKKTMMKTSMQILNLTKKKRKKKLLNKNEKWKQPV